TETNVIACDGHHEPQVCIDHAFARYRIALLDSPRVFDLLVKRQKRHSPNLQQISVEHRIGFVHASNLLAGPDRPLLGICEIFKQRPRGASRSLFRESRFRRRSHAADLHRMPSLCLRTRMMAPVSKSATKPVIPRYAGGNSDARPSPRCYWMEAVVVLATAPRRRELR